jgi:preprotein translocase subunit SecD
MKKLSKLLVWLAMTPLICTSLMPIFAIESKVGQKVVPKTTTTNFVAKLPKSSGDNAETKNLVDGLYLIQREAKSEKELQPIIDPERILINDYEFIAPEERGETSYVVVSKNSFVPIILASKPVKSSDQTGKPKLEIFLADDQIKPLEKFTTDNVMKSVAIVIGGKVVTMHKIRVPIVGGKMQITRCTDHGCEALYTELQKRDSSK